MRSDKQEYTGGKEKSAESEGNLGQTVSAAGLTLLQLSTWRGKPKARA